MSCKDLPPDGGVIKVPGGGLMIAGGLTVPSDGTIGFSSGCVFHHIDGTSTTMLYVNEGTVASCAFKRIVTAARFSSVPAGNITTGTSYVGAETVNLTALSASIDSIGTQLNAITNAITNISV